MVEDVSFFIYIYRYIYIIYIYIIYIYIIYIYYIYIYILYIGDMKYLKYQTGRSLIFSKKDDMDPNLKIKNDAVLLEF